MSVSEETIDPTRCPSILNDVYGFAPRQYPLVESHYTTPEYELLEDDDIFERFRRFCGIDEDDEDDDNDWRYESERMEW